VDWITLCVSTLGVPFWGLHIKHPYHVNFVQRNEIAGAMPHGCPGPDA